MAAEHEQRSHEEPGHRDGSKPTTLEKVQENYRGIPLVAAHLEQREAAADQRRVDLLEQRLSREELRDGRRGQPQKVPGRHDRLPWIRSPAVAACGFWLEWW